ncbi:alpha/beta hydrolase [Goodfellowiella coeruleoviolacea]|uniref:Acetyl esterase/lipase n=1 Tax=Goodfellowiella coeruleoviolacea TaxID=334858 RepID=A0AAE3GDE4_9PSEU|nr:alpha/beta hydrolase [Goodfellowiella coeruleoviolacea]MCP2166256.1 Acetyl esterase/lipase [Goodfellowiella coeruleoviolacea]
MARRVHPPFDPEVAKALPAVNAVLPPSITPDLIGRLREVTSAGHSSGLAELREHVHAEELTAPGPDGTEVPLLVLRPKDTGHPGGTDPAGPLPGLYFIHGGGMVAGSNYTGLDWVLAWMAAIPLVAVSVDYRLAPEHPHPAPVEDCYAGLVWVGEHLAELGIDPDRLVVAGGSAGGGLAAATALLARDRVGPRLRGQLLVCPMLDDRASTPSSTELVGEGVWDSISNATGWSALLGAAAGGPDVSPYAAPARATDLSGLPPAFVEAGSVETYRDEAVAYASRLWQAGGQAELHIWAGGCHNFDGVVPHTPLAREARASRINWLRRVLAA